MFGGGTMAALVTGIAVTFRMLHRSAVNAERKRADQWFEAWKIERQISAENTRQVTTVVSKVERAVEEVQA